MDNSLEVFKNHISKYRKVVIWGLRRQYHTHRYIHAGFYQTLKRLGTEVVWADYNSSQANLIEAGDLVISAFVSGRGVSECFLPIKPGVFYCLHNFPANVLEKIDRKYLLNLQVYTNAAEKSGEKWDAVTFFNKNTQTLYQPWGTNLLPWEFGKPVYNTNKNVFFIGSVWDNALNQGNMNEINELKQALKAHGLRFWALRFIPVWLNKVLIRHSRLAPAIVGRWQAENNYLPCRMFKNISYGQLGFSNVKKFEELFVGCNIGGDSILELADKVLSLSKNDYINIVTRQQEIVKSQTYMNKLINICKAFEIIYQ